jgi:hypothetical protein
MKISISKKPALLITAGIATMAVIGTVAFANSQTPVNHKDTNQTTTTTSPDQQQISTAPDSATPLSQSTPTQSKALTSTGASTQVVNTAAPTDSQTSTDTTPAPITVVGSGVIMGGPYDGDCTLTYSDGSTAHVKATITTVQNGDSSSSTDNCPDFIGQTKE